MKSVCKVLLGVILLLLVLSLCACSKSQPAAHAVADGAKETINTIVANKPECKDVGVVCVQQIDSIVASCDSGFDKLSAEKAKWQWAFWGLLTIIAAFVFKRITL